jgi:hypothetical protein
MTIEQPVINPLDLPLKLAEDLVPILVKFTADFDKANADFLKVFEIKEVGPVETTLALMFIIHFLNSSSLEDDMIDKTFTQMREITKKFLETYQPLQATIVKTKPN